MTRCVPRAGLFCIPAKQAVEARRLATWDAVNLATGEVLYSGLQLPGDAPVPFSSCPWCGARLIETAIVRSAR